MKSITILTVLCALLLALSRVGRTYSLALSPVMSAIMTVAITTAFGLNQGAWIAIVGATAGLLGFFTANSAFPFNPAGDSEVYMTNLEYNQMFRRHLIQSGSFALLALVLGAIVGLCLPGWLLASASGD